MPFITDTRVSFRPARRALAAAVLVAVFMGPASAPAQNSGRSAAADWPTYNRDPRRHALLASGPDRHEQRG